MVRLRNRALERSNRAWNEEQEMRAAMARREMDAEAALPAAAKDK